jgi:type IV pilus assembly protein PilP
VIKNKKVKSNHNTVSLQAIILMVVCSFFTGIVSCSNTAETPKKAEQSRPAAVKTPEKKTPLADKKQTASSPAEANKAGEEFTYDPTGKPDPFVPLVSEIPASRQLAQTASPAVSESELTPLQKYDLSELKLVAIILQGNSEPTAMVEDKAGYGYIIKKGMLIGKNNGIINEINGSGVVVDEKTVEATGAQKTKTTTLTIMKTTLGEK